MPVSAAHPDAIKLDEAFAAAMDTPGKPREPGPPPEVDHDAPHGRGNDGKPLAPYGFTKDGSVRKSPAGRRPAEDKARVGEAAKKPPGKDDKKKPETSVPQRYAPAIAETLEVVWLGGTVLGQVAPDIPVVGNLLPDGDKLQAQAAVILMFKDNIAGAIDLCAQHNEQARKLAVKLSSGQAGWALNAAFMVMPVITTSVRVWGKEEPEINPETKEPLPTLAQQLAENNRKNLQEYMAKLARQAEEFAQEKAFAEAQQGGSPLNGQPVTA